MFRGNLSQYCSGSLEGPPALQGSATRTLILLKKGRDTKRRISISHKLVRELNWWASGGMRANRISLW